MAGKKEAKKYKAPGLLSSLLALPTENLPQNSGGLLTQYSPSLREKIGNAIYDKARSVGLLNAQNMRVNAQNVVDFVPGVGDAVGFNEAGRDIQAGNYGAGIAGLGLAGIGLIPGAGDMAQKVGKKALANAPDGIRAFHGSPHSFDKFSLDKIGTGEGAQAYGHGLYFADNEDVAKSYRDALSLDAGFTYKGKTSLTRDQLAEEIAKDFGGGYLDNVTTPRGVADGVMDELVYGPKSRKLGPERSALREKLLSEIGRTDPGSMYEVNIRANPDDFLDWDKPLSEQSAFQKLKAGLPYEDVPNGSKIGRLAIEDLISKSGDKAKVTNKLKSAGIPGIKYLDAGSRGAGDGSRNYVVFDDKLIDIVRKYGLAGAIGAGLITREMGQQMQDQGLL